VDAVWFHHPWIVLERPFQRVGTGQDWFSGIYASTTKLIPGRTRNFYFLARNTGTGSPQFYGRPPESAGATPRDIYTVGVHFKSLPGKLGVGITISRLRAISAGSRKHRRRACFSCGQESGTASLRAVASGGYTWTNAPGKPRAGLEYLYSSGDRNATDGKHETFDNLSRPTTDNLG